MKPLLLRADNFTPPSRTPWGGSVMRSTLKADCEIAEARRGYAVVGESWELSVEPDFPSETQGGRRLTEVLAADPAAWLGREHRAGRTGTALLMKLLDAADALSVQIHPDDQYVGLKGDESGKPESWYVVSAEPGAGVYLGIREGVTRAQMAEGLAQGADVSGLLNFVPCEVGDFLRIDAGTAHAIGPGLVLVEPQRVVPGKRGVTYRYWDWNRRYAPDGTPSPTGEGRPLHVEHALAVTRWDAPPLARFLDDLRVRAGAPRCEGPPALEVFCGRDEGAIESEFLDVARLSGTGRLALPAWDALLGVTVLAGSVEVDGCRARRGETLVIAAEPHTRRARLQGAHAIVAAVR